MGYPAGVYIKKGKWKSLSSNEDVPIRYLKNSTLPATKVKAFFFFFAITKKKKSTASQGSPEEQQHPREDHSEKARNAYSFSFLLPSFSQKR